ncbi:MAG: protein kinase domain-containing protein [Deltaproteobacteria bacterium]
MPEPERSVTPPSPLAEDVAGRRLAAALADRYRIDRELGRGGMAVVYAAEDLRHRRRVAIKVLDPQLSATVGHERFLREIALAATLQHPHILPLYDSGDANGLLYYVMPLVEGQSLRARLTRDRQLPVDEAIRIATQVAGALEYAHGHGVVHRDIKPENILLDGENALVADFGIAKTLDAAGEALTATGLAIGTPAYMSPEQSSGERHVDGRTDTYALGCVVYEMLAGEPPFTGVSAQAVIAKRFASAAPSLRIVRDTVPVAVDRAVARALARVPADRFATATEFARALSGGVALRDRSTWRNWMIVGAAALVAGAIGASLLSSRGHRRTTDSLAIDLAAKAHSQIDRRSVVSVSRGVELYRQAIARDSNYADAWAGLARALEFARIWRYPVPATPADSVQPLMVRASERAIEADSNSAQAWIARAWVIRDVDPTSRAAMYDALRRALRIDSTVAEAWFLMGNVWGDSLESRRAIDAYRRAISIDPGYKNALAFLAFQYMWMRNNDSALVWADSGKKVDATHITIRQASAEVRRARHDWPEAEEDYQAVIRIGTGSDRITGWAGLAELAYRRGDRHAADTLIARATAAADTIHPSLHDAAYLAWAYAETGQPGRALALLERFEPRFDAHFQVHLQFDPMLDRLRQEPRFRRLLRRPG